MATTPTKNYHSDAADYEKFETECVRKAMLFVFKVWPMWTGWHLTRNLIAYAENQVSISDLVKLLAPRTLILVIVLAIMSSPSLKEYLISRRVGSWAQLSMFVWTQAWIAWVCANMEPGIYQHRQYLGVSMSLYAFFTWALHVPWSIQLYGYSSCYILCWIYFHAVVGFCSLGVVSTGFAVAALLNICANDVHQQRWELFQTLAALLEAQNTSKRIQLAQQGMLQSIFDASCFCDCEGRIVQSTPHMEQLFGAAEGVPLADLAESQQERQRLCSFLERTKQNSLHMASMIQTTMLRKLHGEIEKHQAAIEVKVFCIKFAKCNSSSQIAMDSTEHLHVDRLFVGVQRLSINDTRPAEYKIAFDAGSPDFPIIHSGSDDVCGGTLTSSSLLEMIPTTWHDVFEDWVCNEVQHAPDHRQALSASSMVGLRLDASLSTVVERAWLEMNGPQMREQTTGLPVRLKLQGVRPLEPEDVNFSPSLSRRSQLPTLHSLLPQLPETNEEDDCETMSIF
mmetsp:Transcript_61235/g.115770  ORF Transcript_61235/g.115770 Transcript_61235/m.115770 type:complete len:509 (+) Transcript_61235:77-1603(+)